MQSRLTLFDTASRTNSVSVSLFKLPMTRATTLPLRFTAPITMACPAARSSAPVAALVFVPVLGEAADESFVNLNDPAELLDILSQGDADLVAHEPCRLIGAEAHIPLDLQSAHPLLLTSIKWMTRYQIFQRLVRVLKDCAGQVREAIAGRSAGCALRALPVMPGGERIDLGIAAARAEDAFRPAARYQIADAVALGLKQRVELRRGQLMNGLRTPLP